MADQVPCEPVGKHAFTVCYLPSRAVHAGGDTNAAACEDGVGRIKRGGFWRKLPSKHAL